MNRAVLVAALALGVLAGCSTDAPAQNAGPDWVKLSWTAPGDDSLTGRAAEYDLRYSTSPITAANFGSATRFSGVGVPSNPGVRDSVRVTGLVPATTYFFAIKTADEVPNWSAISNVATMTTLPPPDVTAPAAIRDLRIGALPAMILGHSVVTMVRW